MDRLTINENGRYILKNDVYTSCGYCELVNELGRLEDENWIQRRTLDIRMKMIERLQDDNKALQAALRRAYTDLSSDRN